MKGNKVWQFLGIIFTVASGTLLHFAYEWSGESFFWALFSGVNESTWEHMKLLFFPMFIYALTEDFFIGQNFPNFWCIKFIGIMSGLSLIPAIFYTYNGSFGKSPDWFNIAIFVIATALSYLIENILFNKNIKCLNQQYPLLMLFIIMTAFILFTFYPPSLPLFQDPVTKGYGITQKVT